MHPAHRNRRQRREMAPVASSIVMTTATLRRIVSGRRKLPGRGCMWSLSSAWFSWLVKPWVSQFYIICFLTALKWTWSVNAWWLAQRLVIFYLPDLVYLLLLYVNRPHICLHFVSSPFYLFFGLRSSSLSCTIYFLSFSLFPLLLLTEDFLLLHHFFTPSPHLSVMKCFF